MYVHKYLVDAAFGKTHYGYRGMLLLDGLFSHRSSLCENHTQVLGPQASSLHHCRKHSCIRAAQQPNGGAEQGCASAKNQDPRSTKISHNAEASGSRIPKIPRSNKISESIIPQDPMQTKNFRIQDPPRSHEKNGLRYKIPRIPCKNPAGSYKNEFRDPRSHRIPRNPTETQDFG